MSPKQFPPLRLITFAVLLFATIAAAVPAASVAAAAPPAPVASVVQAEVCDPEVSLSGAISADGKTGTIRNRSASCSFDVGLASYKRFDTNIDNQQLFDYTTAVIGPNQTLTLTITLPNCSAQVDLFYGPVIMSFAGGVRYGTRILNAINVGTTFCVRDPGCTYTIGYWKNHPDAWPVASLKLGSVTYTKAELLSILKQPVKGNGLVALAHQLIGAKLNVAKGADSTAIATTISSADALIGNLRVPPVGSDSLKPAQTSELAGKLDAYNNGVTGPGHCG
jgi:hypothetical protein